MADGRKEESEPDAMARFRREEIASMVQQTLMQLVSSRPGQVTGAMIRDNADQMHEACEAIHDVCARFAMNPAQLEELEERERREVERAEKAEKKAAEKALKDAKEQEKKNEQARAELAKIELRRQQGGAQ